MLLLPVNLGSGMEISIRDLAQLIAKHVGYTGPIEWDTSQAVWRLEGVLVLGDGELP